MINNLDRSIVLASDADFLVTGDRRAGLLQRGSFRRPRIVNPVAFCEEPGLSGGKASGVDNRIDFAMAVGVRDGRRTPSGLS